MPQTTLCLICDGIVLTLGIVGWQSMPTLTLIGGNVPLEMIGEILERLQKMMQWQLGPLVHYDKHTGYFLGQGFYPLDMQGVCDGPTKRSSVMGSKVGPSLTATDVSDTIL